MAAVTQQEKLIRTTLYVVSPALGKQTARLASIPSRTRPPVSCPKAVSTQPLLADSIKTIHQVADLARRTSKQNNAAENPPWTLHLRRQDDGEDVNGFTVIG